MAPLTRRHLPLLLGSVQDQEEQLHRRLVGREVAPGADGAAQLGVQGLDGIRGVEDPADLVGEGVERDDLAPGAAPALADGGVFPAPVARPRRRRAPPRPAAASRAR